MVKKLTYILLFFIPSICTSQIAYNFESGSLSGWLQVPDSRWQASTSSPISGSYSLKHIFNSSLDATDRISIVLPSWNPNSGTITWQAKVRHGYDPSSSNRWWIYLMADQDANQMHLGGTCSGYVVGVNLTESDDLLKLWRVDNGTPQIIISSSLNWQTQIGKVTAGAVEVERKANGMFTLRASPLGSFSSLINYGSTIDNTLSNFSNFGICYSYTSSGDQLLWVDDIMLNFDPLNKNDHTSEVLNPTIQVSSGSIPSTANNSSVAVDVMRFNIRDNATLDILPTTIKELCFKKASSNNAANWLNTICGVRLRGESSEVSVLNQTISSDRIDLSVDSTTIIIPNGQSKEFTLSIFLKPENLEDGSSLKVMIDSAHHGFLAGLSGSDLVNTFSSNVISNEFIVGIEATSLRITQSPVCISKNSPFSLAVGGGDNAGNLDKDFSNNITLSLTLGNGILSSTSGLTKNPILGISEWTDLIYNERGSLRIKATSAGFGEIETDAIQVLNDTSSIVLAAASQPNGIGISSLNTFPAEAIEILRFRLYDTGETDGLPTTVKNVKFSRTEIANTASLYKVIGGVLVKVNGTPIGISEPVIKTSDFTFSFSNNLVVPDGDYVDVSIFIYLNDGGLTDNQNLQLKIEAINHGFSADPTGSTFKSIFPLQVISNIFWIDVIATQLKFSSVPSRVGVLEPFTVSLSAIDLNGNTDKDFAGLVNLSLLSGNGVLEIPSGSASTFFQGTSSFISLSYSIPERFSLLASCSVLNNIASALITCGDSDGGITTIETTLSPILVNSTSTSSQDAVEVMGLNVYDRGSTDDLPLIVSKLSLHCFDPTKAELLNRQVEGFIVNADNRNITIESYSLSNGIFEIIPKEGSLVITDKDTVTLLVSIYLKKGESIDSFPFRFYIPAANHGWESSTIGTDFASNFNSIMYGPECRIVVEATNLRFTKTPFSTIPLQQFEVNVSAIDQFGSIDGDYSDQLILSLDYGTGALTCSNINQNLSLGNAEWSDISLSKVGTYRFKVNGEHLGYTRSNEASCGLNYQCLIQENFESSLNPSWLGSSEWLLSTISTINGAKSLQQKQNENSGVSTLSIPVNFPSIGDQLIEWNFTIKNGDWDPSSDNYFYFALMADSSDLTSGFFVGINPSSGNDLLTLWYSNQGVKTLIASTSYNWNPNDEVKVKIGLTPKGEWKIWYMEKNALWFTLGGVGSYFSNRQMEWCGPVFGYTSSRSGQLWIDDLCVCTTDYPPVLQSVKPLNLNTIKVRFSEKINFEDAQIKTNYSIQDKDEVLVNINSISTETLNEVILKTDPLPFGRLLMKVDKISGLNGTSIKDSIYFGLGESGTFGRLIINEIMANPEPSVGLPTYEYIELFNPTNDTILLNGWRIQLNSYLLSLPNDSILPKQYVLLCSASNVSHFRIYGKSIGVVSFPALLNDGMMIKLFDSKGSLISYVDYSSSWYGDDQKEDGGWSLEKIDYQNLMEGKNNWKASISPSGGTPCAKNSVALANPDITPPRLLSLEITSNQTIKLQFSEPMDSLMLTFSSSYKIDNGMIHPTDVSMIGDDYSTVLLSLPESISQDIKYSLCLSESITDFSGNHVANDCFQFSLPQTPVWNDIVINELLFNPNVGGVDFVEIYNRSDKTFDLSKMLLSNRSSTTNRLDEIYKASDTAKLFFPNDYAVITTNPGLVKKFYNTKNNKAFVKVSGMASFNNDEGKVVLLYNDSTVIDELHYSESMHSQLLNEFKGVSLERINPNFESSSASTWHSAAQTVGFATPTYKNSQWVEPTVRDDAFTLSPETFSPDGDGKDDYLLISYKLPVDGCVANIRLFSANGKEVRRLASNLLIGTEGTLSWDGLDGKNIKVPIGIYIVYIEYFNPKGVVVKYKKTCVVAEKL